MEKLTLDELNKIANDGKKWPDLFYWDKETFRRLIFTARQAIEEQDNELS